MKGIGLVLIGLLLGSAGTLGVLKLLDTTGTIEFTLDRDGKPARVSTRPVGSSEITLRSDRAIVMPELRWRCSYDTDFPSLFTDAPPGPVLDCGRLGALTGGIRTHTNLYYVVVRRGTNSEPRIVFRDRRP